MSSQKRPRDEAAISAKRVRRPAWKGGIVYQIYPRSFYDSNADGIGDIRGMIEKSDYLVDLGVEIVWISPFYESPMKDFGYDISDFRRIDPIFGTMTDFEDLLKEFNSKDLKVVLDFIPNHTSDQHEWFLKSVRNEPQYKDFYVWKDPAGFSDAGDPIPPNNWLSVFRYSAWEWSDERQQFYLHHFLKEQPDLNFRNPDVIKEMKDVLRFWLDKGVSGFRIDALKFLCEVEEMHGADEPVAQNASTTDPTQYDYLTHTHTINQPETFEVISGWRQLIDEYTDRIMMAEVCDDDISQVMRYYGSEKRPLADFPFNFFLMGCLKSRNDVTGHKLKSSIDLWLDKMPTGKWPNWVLGNHDVKRVASRVGVDLVDALNILVLLLPGTPVTYYGEEIGMTDTFISYEDNRDPLGFQNGPQHYLEFTRDPSRTPMQWDASKFSGFTNGRRTWLPVNENYKILNVESQRKTEESHLKLYQQLARLRKQPAFQFGGLHFQIVTEQILSFIRSAENGPRFAVVLNVSEEATVCDLSKGKTQLPSTASVVLRSSSDSRPETRPGSTLQLSQLSLIGGEGMVLEINEE